MMHLKRFFLLFIFSFFSFLQLFAQDLSGTWEGQLELAGKKFDFALYLSDNGGGKYGGVEYVRERLSAKFSLANLDPSNLEKTLGGISTNALNGDRPSVKANIVGMFAGNVFEFADLSFFETKGKSSIFQLGSLILNYSGGNKERLSASLDGVKAELKKKSKDYPADYLSYAELSSSVTLSEVKGNLAKAVYKSNFSSIVPSSAAAKVKVPRVVACLSGDCENGFGTKSYADYIYEGNFKNGKSEGQGTVTFDNGDVYKGAFAHDNFNGFGTYTFKRSMDVKTYDGVFVENNIQGKSKFTTWSGEVFTVVTTENRLHGYGERTKDGLSRIGYWDLAYWDGNFKGLELPVLRKYLDENFSKFVKTSGLTPCMVSLNAIGLGRVNYDRISTIDGKKIGETSDWDVVGSNTDHKGFINNTNHKIYIKAYRKIYPKEGGPAMYVDESFVVKPGMKILGTYRKIPEEGVLLDKFFQMEYFFLGQYADKSSGVMASKK